MISAIICFSIILCAALFVLIEPHDVMATARMRRLRKDAERMRKAVALETSESLKLEKGKPDYAVIRELEAETWGEGLAIADLPGYTWKVELNKSASYLIRLLDPEGTSVGQHTVGQNHPDQSGRKNFGPPRTEEELDQIIQSVMEDLVKKRLADINTKLMQQRIVEKYNGKSVVQENEVCCCEGFRR